MWTLRGLMNHKSILVLEGSNTEHDNNYCIWCSISPHHSVSLIISLTTLLKVNFVQLNQQSCLKLLFSEETSSISLYYESREAICNRKACFCSFGHLFVIDLCFIFHGPSFILKFSQSYFMVDVTLAVLVGLTGCPKLDWFHLFLVMINCFNDCLGRSNQGRILDYKIVSFWGPSLSESPL